MVLKRILTVLPLESLGTKVDMACYPDGPLVRSEFKMYKRSKHEEREQEIVTRVAYNGKNNLTFMTAITI